MFVREIILMYVIQPDFKTSSDPLSPAVWARPDCVRTSSAPLVCLTHHRCNETEEFSNAVCNFCFPSAVHVVSESCRHVCCSCLSERCLLHLQNGRCNFCFVCVAGLNVSLWVNDWDCLLIKKKVYYPEHHPTHRYTVDRSDYNVKMKLQQKENKEKWHRCWNTESPS